MTTLRDRVGTEMQYMGIESGNAHKGTAVARREATDGEKGRTGKRAGSSGRS